MSRCLDLADADIARDTAAPERAQGRERRCAIRVIMYFSLSHFPDARKGVSRRGVQRYRRDIPAAFTAGPIRIGVTHGPVCTMMYK